MNIEDFKSARFNIIGKDSRIEGDMYFEGRTSISGHIKGNLFSNEGSLVIIEKSATVIGNITAHDIEVHGKVEGELRTKGTLSIKAGSVVDGVIEAERLVIYPGALINSKATAG
jgi:cytoskeletal protein CcmA (bactofilin family)